MDKLTMDIMDPFRNEPIKPYPNKPPVVRKGGKRYLAKTIVPLINSYDYSMYVEPFFGGGRIFFEKQPHWCEIINDIEGRLMNLFYCGKRFPELLVQLQQLIIKDQNEFFRIHANYKNAEKLAKIRQEIVDGIEYVNFMKESQDSLAFRNCRATLLLHAIEFYYYSNMSWRGSNSGTFTLFENDPPAESNRMRWRVFRPLIWMADRLRRTQILTYDFNKVFDIALKATNHTRIWYLDPPYFKTAGYETPFGWEKYRELNNQLMNLNPATDYFILSLNSLEEYKDIFTECHFEPVYTRHSYAAGKNNQENDKNKMGNVKEWLITPPWKPKIKKELMKEQTTQRKLM